ncbi:MAG: hypothetical protein LQ348_006289 [Seirophora lacunosa]|nr:MAG: hypothetical protein LQ348_006289 [Seirophora lacunosa]
MRISSFLVLFLHLLSTSLALPAAFSGLEDIPGVRAGDDAARDLSIHINADFKRALRGPLRITSPPGPLPYRHSLLPAHLGLSILFEAYGDPVPRFPAEVLLIRFISRYDRITRDSPQGGATWINRVQAMQAEGSPLEIDLNPRLPYVLTAAQLQFYMRGLRGFFHQYGFVECQFVLQFQDEESAEGEYETLAHGNFEVD